MSTVLAFSPTVARRVAGLVGAALFSTMLLSPYDFAATARSLASFMLGV
jgi:hypothetical protein